jgi:glycosyltransferase involved in cell wall biosynthesis
VLYNFNKEIICEKCLGKRIKLYPVFFPCERRGYFYSVLKAIRSFISNNLFMHKKVVDKFIVPSNLMLNKLLEEGIHKSKIYLLRNPVIVKENTIVKKANIIAYFGRISKEKDVKFILEAFNYWKSKSKNDFKLYIIGDGEEKENLKNYVVKLSFANDIKIFDFLIDKDLFVKLEQVKYLIMASKLYENAPMTLLEAVSLNIIPIVPDLGGMKETVQDVLKFGRVYEKENIDSLIENIESLELNYNNELEILSKRKIFIFENYGVEKYHEKLKELYSIINNSTI